MRAHVYPLCTRIYAQIVIKFETLAHKIANDYHIKFHEDLSLRYGDIGKIKLTFCNQEFSMYFCNINQKKFFFWMSIDFFQRLKTLNGTYFYQMSCTRNDFSAKISLKDYFWWDLIGVWKITLLSKDPVGRRKRAQR